MTAVKAIQRNRLRRIGSANKDLTQEVNVLKTLCHINIVKLHEVIDDPQNSKIFLVMDYLPEGTLSDKLQDPEYE
jgi:serine/threonine protein kinase